MKLIEIKRETVNGKKNEDLDKKLFDRRSYKFALELDGKVKAALIIAEDEYDQIFGASEDVLNLLNDFIKNDVERYEAVMALAKLLHLDEEDIDEPDDCEDCRFNYLCSQETKDNHDNRKKKEKNHGKEAS